MKTNQKMIVKIPNFGDLTIEHKTHIGSVKDVMDMGNKLRIKEGEKPLVLADILRRRNIWKFILIRDEKIKQTGLDRNNTTNNDNMGCGESPHPIANYSIIDEHYNSSKGRIDYKRLIKHFPNTIQSKRSSKNQNGGTWAELHVLLKIASILSTRLEVEIYEVFVSSEILKVRDNGGDSYKILNYHLNILPDRKSHNNRGIFINVAKEIRLNFFTSKQVSEFTTKDNIWNSAYATRDILIKRDKIENEIITMISYGVIEDYQNSFKSMFAKILEKNR